ncbi:MAG: hypothetical protein IPM59_03770 [Chloracidobacterium sp.]|nr:hypothetical protein [Chloracidobacterium sp.]
MDSVLNHIDRVRKGRFLAFLTIIWNSVEGIIAVSAGVLAGSVEGVDAIRGKTCCDTNECH